MKKYLLILVILAILICIPSINDKKITLAGKILENEEYQIFQLTFDNNILTTKNFNSFFDAKSKIIYVVANINPLYERKIGSEVIYHFNENNISFNMKNFINYYKQIMTNNGYLNGNENIYYEGIGIKKVVLYENEKTIKKIVSQNQKIQYQIIEHF